MMQIPIAALAQCRNAMPGCQGPLRALMLAAGLIAVVATGHTAPLVLPDLRTVEHYDRHLTLDGLRMLAERNPAPALPRDRSRLADTD